ncbi:DUF3180 domain-containing protein [Nakamurella leprariae]|uniref:DUF3180 domain-containing protein n=1 Tax=Nakamurella leprariae TaxID=2803911 RepID=A0A938YEI7_9ACTN|nr:DUF3180 domain-containing protein [Nakamurella leprariae]MBM9466308.1 DUF3180 domain-containing protein [Nakamurella leprariae]
MSTSRGPGAPEPSVGFTRTRDLIAVALVAAVVGHLVVRLSYDSMPPLPRFAGAVPAVLGVAEALWGLALRGRIREQWRSPDPSRPGPTDRPAGEAGSVGGGRPPVPALTAARALQAAKATSLAGAALGGLWLGLLGYVVPEAGRVTAAAGDLTTGIIGVAGAAIMVAGALVLEHCLRAPDRSDRRR